MGMYRDAVFPRVLNLVMNTKVTREIRERVCAGLEGEVVEIGFGTLSARGTRLQIDLPGEGWTVVHCEPLHIAGHNAFAVRFIWPVVE